MNTSAEQQKTGGPAFPVSTGDPHASCQDGPETAQFPGMTLRDYFAAQAFSGILGCYRDYENATDTAGRARFAYLCADAMLKARAA